MDSDQSAIISKEISHLVLDANEKVTVISLSENWSIVLQQATKVLTQWVSKNSTKKKSLALEFIVRGTDINGNHMITVVPEKHLKTFEAKLSKSTSALYSVEIESTNEMLNMIKISEGRMMNLSLEPKIRRFEELIPPAPEPSFSKKVPPKKEVVNMFTAKSIKKETSEPTAGTSTEAKEETAVKIEERAKSSDREKVSQKKSVTPKATQVKGSISSFFLNPPKKPFVADKQDNAKEVAIETEKTVQMIGKSTVTELAEVKVDSTPKNKQRPLSMKKEKQDKSLIKGTDDIKITTRKRTVSSDEEIPCTPQEKPTAQRRKKAKHLASKKDQQPWSRIAQLCEDSSDEEESKDIKVPMEPDEPDEPEKLLPKVPEKKRFKAKRTVTKTCMDEDGYYKTVREVEEYSCSEDEQEQKVVQMSPAQSKPGPPSKKKVTAKLSTKQGSIKSFFSKK